MPPIDLGDVQGNILKSFGKPNMHLLYLRFDDPAASANWLSALASRTPSIIPNTSDLIRSSERLRNNPDQPLRETWLHISLSYPGVRTLGLEPPPSTASNGRDPFEAGMPHRAILADIEDSAPENWVPPFTLTRDGNGNDTSERIHALFILASDKEEDLQGEVSRMTAQASQNGLTCVGEQNGKAIRKQGHQVEHFGFHDGISQPLIRGVDDHHLSERTVYRDVHDPAEFVLSGLQGAVQWANNGSFLVLRRLRQDVHGFWAFIDGESRRLGMTKEQLAAKFMGRWKSGGSLAQNPTPPRRYSAEDNDFLYRRDDPRGIMTPKFSHIRKVNARDSDRDSDRHRILRRGIPYGPWWKRRQRMDSNEDRGLLFICYQKDIAEQFEYIQSRWASRETFPADPDDRVRPGPDPICGQHYGRKGPVNLFHAGRSISIGINQWVTTTGGGYFFSPAISALRSISNPRS